MNPSWPTLGQRKWKLTLHSQADLVGHVSDLPNGVGQVVVFFQKVKGAESKQLKGDAHVTVVVKPVVHLYTQAAKWHKRMVNSTSFNMD